MSISNLPAAPCSQKIAYPTDLFSLHENLNHPGMHKLFKYIQLNSLPYTFSEFQSMTNNYEMSCVNKPSFVRVPKSPLIKSTSPMQHISIDYKGPIESDSQYKYLLVCVDKYSRYMWACPTANCSTDMTIKCLKKLFSTFGRPKSIHSDNATSFTSRTFNNFLNNLRIYLTHSSIYHPQGNSAAEKSVQTIWRNVTLMLATQIFPCASGLKWWTTA